MQRVYDGVVFPPGVRPLPDFGTKIMAQVHSARVILKGQPVGTVQSWGDSWVWMVLAAENGETRVVPVNMDQQEQAKAPSTIFALVDDGTRRVLVFTPEGNMIRNLEARWMRRAETAEDLPTTEDLKEFRVASPDELSSLQAEAKKALGT